VNQHQANKALHPTAYSSVRCVSLVPRSTSLSSLPAAGELIVVLQRAALREIEMKPFVLVKDFYHKDDVQFGVLDADEQHYMFGDGDAYTPEQVRVLMPQAKYLSWPEVERKLADAD
jgi:hypothetical protein